MSNSKNILLIILVLSSCIYASAQSDKKLRMSFQGYFPNSFILNNYIAPESVDAVVFQAPFYSIEIAKLNNDFSDIDTFDLVNPNAFRILTEIKTDYNCFGYSRYNYRDYFFKTLLGDSYSKENLDELIDEGRVPLTAIQAALITFYKNPSNERKVFWYDSDIVQGMDIIFLDIFHENEHFDDNDYIYNDEDGFKYIIFIKSGEFKKELKKIRKEFKLSHKSLNKKTTQTELNKGGSLQLIIW